MLALPKRLRLDPARWDFKLRVLALVRSVIGIHCTIAGAALLRCSAGRPLHLRPGPVGLDSKLQMLTLSKYLRIGPVRWDSKLRVLASGCSVIGIHCTIAGAACCSAESIHFYRGCSVAVTAIAVS